MAKPSAQVVMDSKNPADIRWLREPGFRSETRARERIGIAEGHEIEPRERRVFALRMPVDPEGHRLHAIGEDERTEHPVPHGEHDTEVAIEVRGGAAVVELMLRGADKDPLERAE